MVNRTIILCIALLLLLSVGCSESGGRKLVTRPSIPATAVSSTPVTTISSIPSHYTIVETYSGSTSGGGGGGEINIEVKEGSILSASFRTYYSSSISSYNCTGVKARDNADDICWIGSCDIDQRVGEDTGFRSVSDMIWQCSNYSYQVQPYKTYEGLLILVEEKVRDAEQGKPLSSYGKIEGQDELPAIYRAKQGCNNVICFEDGYIKSFSWGKRYSETYTVSVVKP